MHKIDELYQEMINYCYGNPKYAQHFIKVHSLAKLIGQQEGIPENELFILECAALVHDIGIKAAKEKYGKSDGKLQEQEGPALAKEMLRKLNIEEDVVKRVCYLVGHHHTYHDISGNDYQILVEADFIVNFCEDEVDKQVIKVTLSKIFKTVTGKRIVETMFGIEG